MSNLEKLVLNKYAEYSSILTYVAGQVTQDGALLLIETAESELDFFERPVKKRDWTIRIIKEDGIDTIVLKKVPLIPTHVDIFSDGSLLIVQGRCLKEDNYIERNARRYNPNGQLIDAFTLGDGINDIQIDDNDTIWVSYFDEGIFGNFGWDEPIGSDGVIAFSITGEKLWGAGDYGIIDCYALNVANSKEVYFYYYDDFHLVCLDEMKESARYHVRGPDTLQQFIFSQSDLIGLIDMYTLKRFRLQVRSLKPTEKIQIVDEKGKRIIGPIFMRGTFLFAYGKDGIYGRKF
ncbi:hypothetical protein [Sutcliffiella cohnii]|uniref:hypothetical protein n=1 Tax=Sutcliffiella cohnii TaxID=33932 RepID=UPI002E24A180|nr:hypothetical protein [Sutcliffiella cohnii]